MQHGTTSSVSNITGLSVATCGNVIKSLVQTGEIIEVEMVESHGGRPDVISTMPTIRMLSAYM
jgi:hypothetical protein